MNDKTLTLMGFAAKAGRLCYGMNAAVGAVISHKARLVLCACDVSEKSRKELSFHCNKNSVQLLIFDGFDMKTVSDAVGRKCGIISVNDSGFADALLKAYKEGGNADDE